MLNKLISKILLIFLISAAAYSQGSNQIVVLNRNINVSGGYAQSTALIGYPPYSDVWVMHSGRELNSGNVYTRAVVFRSTPVFYTIAPASFTYDPYSMYMNAGSRWTPEAAEAVVITGNSNTVVYRNYVRPTDKEDYYVNYLEPAPVVTLYTNTIVPPHGVKFYKTSRETKHPIRDYRADFWQNKYYRDMNKSPRYDTYSSFFDNITAAGESD